METLELSEAQRQRAIEMGLNPDDWLVEKDTNRPVKRPKPNAMNPIAASFIRPFVDAARQVPGEFANLAQAGVSKLPVNPQVAAVLLQMMNFGQNKALEEGAKKFDERFIAGTEFTGAPIEGLANVAGSIGAGIGPYMIPGVGFVTGPLISGARASADMREESDGKASPTARAAGAGASIALDAIPIAKFIKAAPGLGRAFKSGVGFGLASGADRMAQNAIAGMDYAPNRSLLEGVGTAAMVGGGLGAGFNLRPRATAPDEFAPTARPAEVPVNSRPAAADVNIRPAVDAPPVLEAPPVMQRSTDAAMAQAAIANTKMFAKMHPGEQVTLIWRAADGNPTPETFAQIREVYKKQSGAEPTDFQIARRLAKTPQEMWSPAAIDSLLATPTESLKDVGMMKDPVGRAILTLRDEGYTIQREHFADFVRDPKGTEAMYRQKFSPDAMAAKAAEEAKAEADKAAAEQAKQDKAAEKAAAKLEQEAAKAAKAEEAAAAKQVAVDEKLAAEAAAEQTKAAAAEPAKVEAEPAPVPEAEPAPVAPAATVNPPAALETAKPGYKVGKRAFYTEFADPVDKAAYIVASGKASKSKAELRAWLEQQGLAADAVKQRASEIKERLKALSADAKSGDTLQIAPTPPREIDTEQLQVRKKNNKYYIYDPENKQWLNRLNAKRVSDAHEEARTIIAQKQELRPEPPPPRSYKDDGYNISLQGGSYVLRNPKTGEILVDLKTTSPGEARQKADAFYKNLRAEQGTRPKTDAPASSPEAGASKTDVNTGPYIDPDGVEYLSGPLSLKTLDTMLDNTVDFAVRNSRAVLKRLSDLGRKGDRTAGYAADHAAKFLARAQMAANKRAEEVRNTFRGYNGKEITNVGAAMKEAEIYGFHTRSLTPKEQTLVAEVNDLMRRWGAEEAADGPWVKDGNTFRPKNFKDFYTPDALLAGVFNDLKKGRNIPQRRAEFEQALRGQGYGPAEIDAEWKAFTDNLNKLLAYHNGDIDAAGIGFSALRKPASYAYPPEWQTSLPRRLSRYALKSGYDMEYYKGIETDPVMATLLGIKEDGRGNPIPDTFALPDGTPLDLTDHRTTKLLSTAMDMTAALLNPQIGVGWQRFKQFTSIIQKGAVQLPQGIRDVALTPAALSAVVGPFNTLKGLATFLQNYRQLSREGFIRKNPELKVDMLRLRESGFDDFLDSLNTAAGMFNTLVPFDATQRLISAWSAMAGKYGVREAIAKGDDAFFQKLGIDDWRTIPAAELEQLGTKYVHDEIVSSYDARDIPETFGDTKESVLGIFSPIMRWSVGQANRQIDNTLRPLLERGDFKPLLWRAVGGVIAMEAIDELYEMIAKKKPRDLSLQEWFDAGSPKAGQYILSRLASANVGGTLTQLMSLAAPAGERRFAPQNMAMAIAPRLWQIVTDFVNAPSDQPGDFGVLINEMLKTYSSAYRDIENMIQDRYTPVDTAYSIYQRYYEPWTNPRSISVPNAFDANRKLRLARTQQEVDEAAAQIIARLRENPELPAPTVTKPYVDDIKFWNWVEQTYGPGTKYRWLQQDRSEMPLYEYKKAAAEAIRAKLPPREKLEIRPEGNFLKTERR